VSEAFETIVGKVCVERGWVTRDQLVLDATLIDLRGIVEEVVETVRHPPSLYGVARTRWRLTDLRAVLDWLVESPHCTGALGAMGICIGGHLAFRAALQPDVRSAACFYATDLHKGSLGRGGDDSLARAAAIRGELMLVWGRQDPHIPDDGRAAIQRRLIEVGCTFTWHEHNAQHAFLRDEGPRYDPALALTSYAAVVELFRRTLA
jgi:dienelactone hydrolase